MKIALNECNDKLPCIYKNLDQPLSKALRNINVLQTREAQWPNGLEL